MAAKLKSVSRVGIWIDHKQAIIVRVGARSMQISKVPAKVAPRVKTAGGYRVKGVGSRSGGGGGEWHMRHHREQQLHKYYQSVIKRVASADELLLLGPSMAKKELSAELKRTFRKGKSVAIVTTGKLTPKQLMLKVAKHFGVAVE